MKNVAAAIDRINKARIFNPERWPHREHVGRISAVVIVSGFLIAKLVYFDPLPGSLQSTKQFYLGLARYYGSTAFDDSTIYLLWLLRHFVRIAENAILLGYLAAYLTRTEAVAVARGVEQVLFPFAVAALPMVMALAPVNFTQFLPLTSRFYVFYYTAVMGLIFIGATINLVGLLTMRRAFSIMSEARVLVTGGIFRFIRHPLYTGHFIMFFGSLCLRLYSYTILIYILFVVGQVIRARIEENKLSEQFPQYQSYKKTTGMFFPRIGG